MVAPTGLIVPLNFVCRGGYYSPAIYKNIIAFCADSRGRLSLQQMFMFYRHILYEKNEPRHRRGSFFALYCFNNVFDNRKEALEGSDVERLVGRMQIKHDGTA